MSADNWAICPVCVGRAREKAAREHAAAMESYGAIPAEEFQARLAAIKDVKPEDFRTFREDYEIYGAAEGTVTVSYSGSCSVCGTHLEFNDHHAIPGAAS